MFSIDYLYINISVTVCLIYLTLYDSHNNHYYRTNKLNQTNFTFCVLFYIVFMFV